MTLVPVSLAEAKAFVAQHHRHNGAPLTWKFGVGVAVEGELVGVAMAGLPKARMAMQPGVLEVNRTCTLGTPNANSMLYGAIARAAKALGYRKLITYTLDSEPGSSLKAAGWIVDGHVTPETWERRREQLPGMGNDRIPSGPKTRWRKDLGLP